MHICACVGRSVCRSVGRSVRHTLAFSAFSGFTAPAQSHATGPAVYMAANLSVFLRRHYGLRFSKSGQKNLRLCFSAMGMPETCTVAYADQSYIGFCLPPGPSMATFLSPK